MLIPHRFDVSALLRRDSENRLVVRLGSALNAARQYSYPPLLSSVEDRLESLWIRKAPHMYGWDITPRIVSAGLWRGVEVEAIPSTHLESLYFWTDALDAAGPHLGVQVHAGSESAGVDGLELRLTGTCGDHSFQQTLPLEFVSTQTSFPIPDGRLWWPRDYGEPALYTVRAELLEHGIVRDTRVERIGLRQARLERTEIGGPEGQFLFRINGVPIQITGSNWARSMPSTVATPSATTPPSTSRRISIVVCCAVGVGTYMRISVSSTCAMNGASSSGKISPLPARGIPRPTSSLPRSMRKPVVL